MRSWLGSFIGCLLVAAGCAASVDDGVVDGGEGGSADSSFESLPDARPIADAQPRFDAPFQHEFNESCHDRGECTTEICILAPTGGYCSRLCNGGNCPQGFGCYGVLGLLEPGQVSYVCVKQTNLLCSPCMTATECSPTSSDLCLPATSGGSFCARDCSMEGCPAGYQCASVGGDAGVAKQCLPVSGACDCQAADSGHKKDCTLTTPAGDSCKGERTCLGGAGWGDCKPPSAADVPDVNYADENCDGIDGTVGDGMFVATAANGGEDNDGCGPSALNPCATISNGTRRAKLLGKKYVFVQAGTYKETVIMRDGIGVYGGYDSKWKRAPRVSPGHEVTIEGQLYATDDQFVAVVAHDLASETILADVIIAGATATGSSLGSGRSSYGIHAAAAKLRVERVTINAGKGANGLPGGIGLPAPLIYAAPEMSGEIGADGQGGASVCSTSTRGGGAAGANTCSSYASGDPGAGKGGDGGSKDTTCPCAFGGCWDATPGDGGDPAPVWVVNGYGHGGAGGSGMGDCGPAAPGGDGRIINGDGGAGGKAGGRLVNRYWYAFPGQAGKLGLHGGGGGGGGGSGGCDDGTDSRGAGGGGGGAGGCAARGGGPPGEGGGGSFGLFAVAGSMVTVRSVTITQALGGNAGKGGTGGQGQSGGLGVKGGERGDDDGQPGEKGGNGGHGGHAGGGGGGAGGVTYGIYSQTGSTVDLDSGSMINDGAVRGGDPGQPGVSAPDAPLPERDGQPGFIGAAGGAGKTYVCQSPDGC